MTLCKCVLLAPQFKFELSCCGWIFSSQLFSSSYVKRLVRDHLFDRQKSPGVIEEEGRVYVKLENEKVASVPRTSSLSVKGELTFDPSTQMLMY